MTYSTQQGWTVLPPQIITADIRVPYTRTSCRTYWTLISPKKQNPQTNGKLFTNFLYDTCDTLYSTKEKLKKKTRANPTQTNTPPQWPPSTPFKIFTLTLTKPIMVHLLENGIKLSPTPRPRGVERR